MKAFPHGFINERGNRCENFGMDLRDYFAAKAIGGMCMGAPAPQKNEIDYLAKRSYEIADAMLKAREQK